MNVYENPYVYIISIRLSINVFFYTKAVLECAHEASTILIKLNCKIQLQLRHIHMHKGLLLCNNGHTHKRKLIMWHAAQ